MHPHFYVVHRRSLFSRWLCARDRSYRLAAGLATVPMNTFWCLRPSISIGEAQPIYSRLRRSVTGSYYMLAAAKRVDRLRETHIGRIIACDHTAGAFLANFRSGALALLLLIPAVVLGHYPRALEAAFLIGKRAAALERGRFGGVGHGVELRAVGSMCR